MTLMMSRSPGVVRADLPPRHGLHDGLKSVGLREGGGSHPLPHYRLKGRATLGKAWSIVGFMDIGKRHVDMLGTPLSNASFVT